MDMFGEPTFDPDPLAFFSSVAGPSASDIVGPPSDVLDTFVDGTPIAESQSAVANQTGGGRHTRFFHRGDVQAAAMLIAGIVLIRGYLGAD